MNPLTKIKIVGQKNDEILINVRLVFAPQKMVTDIHEQIRKDSLNNRTKKKKYKTEVSKFVILDQTTILTQKVSE